MIFPSNKEVLIGEDVFVDVNAFTPVGTWMLYAEE
jgi:hypothetical protein